MAESSPQVLIVGAGPAGLTLALGLLKQGIAVRIIAKENAYRPGRRCAGISPRTLEVFKILGVLQAVEKIATGVVPVTRYKLPGGVEPLRTWMMHKPEKSTPNRPYVNAVFIGQDQLEHILREELSKFSCNVELGNELVSFVQDEDHVVAVIRKTTEDDQQISETLKVPFLVGADGAKGVTRGQLGLGFVGETKDEQFIVEDVRLDGLSNTKIHMWSVEKPSVTIILIWPGQDDSGDIFTIQMAGKDIDRPRLISEEGYFEQYFHEKTDRTDVKFQEILYISEYNPNIGMVEKFGEGRVFLAGDSAHVHSLMGGQGLNSGIQDSFNLSWKLGYVIKGISNAALLSTYTEERLPVIAEMLNKTTEIHDKFKSSGRFDDTSLRERNRSLDQLGVNYRWSSIVLQDQATANADLGVYGRDFEESPAEAGDRAPDAPELFDKEGLAHTLLALFSCTRDTILIFSPTSQQVDEIRQVVSKMPQEMALLVSIFGNDSEISVNINSDLVLHDTKGYAHTAYGVQNDIHRIVTVRPDAVIGAIVNDIHGFKRYYNALSLPQS